MKPEEEGMARVFAVQVQNFEDYTSVEVQNSHETSWLSRYCYFINSSGAVRVFRDY